MSQKKVSNLSWGSGSLPAWLEILLVVVLVIVLAFIALDETLVKGSQKISVQTVYSQDQSKIAAQLEKEYSMVKTEQFIQTQITSGYEKKIGVLPNSRWYVFKINLEKFKGSLYGGEKRDLYRAKFLQKRLEEAFIMYRLGDVVGLEKSLNYYLPQVKSVDKNKLRKLLPTSSVSIQYGKIFGLVMYLNQNSDFASNPVFREVYSETSKLWQ